MYWTNYVLCWLILPFLTYYFDAVQLTKCGKTCYAIRMNLIYYFIGFAALAIFITAFWYFNGMIEFEYIQSFLMAISTAWALFQIILFLSNGIIDVPRDFWRRRSNVDRLRTLTCKFAQMEELMNDTKIDIENYIKKLQAIEIVARDTEEYIGEIFKTIPEDITSFRSMTGAVPPDLNAGTTPSERHKKIPDIHYDLKISLADYDVYQSYLYGINFQDVYALHKRSGFSWRCYPVHQKKPFIHTRRKPTSKTFILGKT